MRRTTVVLIGLNRQKRKLLTIWIIPRSPILA